MDPVDAADDVQRRMSAQRLVVVGAGGLGLAFIVDAAYAGFRHFTLCDDDTLEPSNLDRWFAATPDDVGTPKVELLRRFLAARFADIDLRPIAEAFPGPSSLSAFSAERVVIGCVDRVDSRIDLDVFCRRSGCTLIDLGCGFRDEDQRGGGQVLISRPDGPCLSCLGFQSLQQRHAYHADEEQARSSLLLNQVVAALGVQALVDVLVGQQRANRIAYDAATPSVIASSLAGRSECRVCGTDAAGHLRSLTEREWLRATLNR